jgi:hypothetical protein
MDTNWDRNWGWDWASALSSLVFVSLSLCLLGLAFGYRHFNGLAWYMASGFWFLISRSGWHTIWCPVFWFGCVGHTDDLAMLA